MSCLRRASRRTVRPEQERGHQIGMGQETAEPTEEGSAVYQGI